MTGKAKGLNHEDRRLWTRVAQSTKPLPDQQRNLQRHLEDLLHEAALSEVILGETADPHATLSPAFKKVVRSTTPSPSLNPANPPESQSYSHHHAIDRPTMKKLAKGRQKIDGRIDLHGMTQERARAALLDFLSMARAADYRIVLVITGKGNLGTGVLKQRVPDWLQVPPFSDMVSGYRLSHGHHGGEGALYVRIRRRKNLPHQNLGGKMR